MILCKQKGSKIVDEFPGWYSTIVELFHRAVGSLQRLLVVVDGNIFSPEF